MRKISIPVSLRVEDLVESSPGSYSFVVLAKTTGGAALNNPKIPNTSTITASSPIISSGRAHFVIIVPTTLDLSDTVSTFRLEVYRDSALDCCVRHDEISIGIDCGKASTLIEIWPRFLSLSPLLTYNSHLQASEAACNMSGVHSTAFVDLSVSTGNKVWVNSSPGNCETLPDGYYYFRDPSSGNLAPHTLKIESGTITEMVTFDCEEDGIGNNSTLSLITTT